MGVLFPGRRELDSRVIDGSVNTVRSFWSSRFSVRCLAGGRWKVLSWIEGGCLES